MGHYRPDILDRIRLANLLAPVTSETNMGGPLGWIAEAGGIIDDILTLMGVGEFLPSNWLVDCLSSLFYHEGEKTHPGFHAFDWGSDRLNVQHHQSTEPPLYDLARVTAP